MIDLDPYKVTAEYLQGTPLEQANGTYLAPGYGLRKRLPAKVSHVMQSCVGPLHAAQNGRSWMASTGLRRLQQNL